ncbi:unnamed protein product [marine sediment metagenome]|uniref:Uncharacterized protein n=1 Tax=marine sediment metagenome TaxID=412755 RepID=X1RE37_9ZZZZ
MPEVLRNPPSPRTALFWNGTAWQYALVGLGGRLIVRGEDQLFSISGVLAITVAGLISGADGTIQTPAVPAGSYWVVTSVVARDVTSPTTAIALHNFHNGVGTNIKRELRAFAANEDLCWTGHTYLDVDDVILAEYSGGLVGDTCGLHVTGYVMTVET